MADQNDVTLQLKVISEGAGKVNDLAKAFDNLQSEIEEAAKAGDAPQLEGQVQQYGEMAASLRAVGSELAGLRAIGQEIAEMGKSGELASGQVARLTGDLEKIGSTRSAIVQFQALSQQIEHTEQKLAAARVRYNQLNAAQDASTRQVNQAAREVSRLEQGMTGQVTALDACRASLNKYGITINNLGDLDRELIASQDQLRQKMQEVAEVGNSRNLLGVRAHDEIQREIKETIAAYNTLKASGMLSQQELAQAALKTKERIRELERQTNGWAESLGKAKSELAGVGASLAGFAYAGKEAVGFESAMADVAKVVDGTDEQIQQLANSIKLMSRELPLTANELAAIAAAGGQLGVPIDKMEQFIALTAKMASAFGISADQAGQAVGKLITIFDLPLEGVQDLGNALNLLGNNTAATEKGLLEFLTRVGGQAKQFGLSAQEVSALGAAFLSMGKTPEVASTAVNSLLLKLQTANVQGDEFKVALAGMGMSAVQLAENIRANPQAALSDFLKTLQTLEPQARAETLAKLFGLEYADDIASLTGSLGAYEQALAMVADRQRAAGSLDAEFQKRVQTTEAQLQLLKNALSEVAINFGSTFLPAVSATAKVLADGSAALAGFIDQHPNLSLLAGTLVSLRLSIKGLELAAMAARVAFTGMTGTATADMALLASKIGLTTKALTVLKTSLGVVGAAFAGWEIGTYLREEFETVNKAGIALAGGLHELAESARYAWELVQAVFTDDTWEEAEARHKQRLQEIQDGYAELFAEAERGGAGAKKANEEAAQSAAMHADAAGKVVHQQRQSAQAAGEQAAAMNGVATAQAAAAVSADKLVTSILALSANGKDGSQAVRDLIESIDLLQPGNAQSVAHAFSEVEMQSAAAGRTVRDQLIESLNKLNATDLAAFSNQLATAYQSGNLSAQEFARVNDMVLGASFNALGLTAEQALGRITPAAQAAMDSVEAIRVALSNGGIEGEARMQALGEAIAAAIGRADTPAALDMLREKIEAMGMSGELAEPKLAKLMETLKAKADEAREGINSLDEALKTFGIQTQAEAKAMADKFSEAWARIKNDGTVTLEQKRTAFIQYANAAIAANKGVADSLIQSQAEMLGLELKADSTGRTIVARMNEAANATGKIAGEAENAVYMLGEMADAADQAADKAQGAADKVRDVGREGGRRGGRGNGEFERQAGALNYIGIINYLKQAGLNDQTAQRIAEEFVDDQGNVPFFSNPGQLKYGGKGSTLTDALGKAAVQERRKGGSSTTDTGNAGKQQPDHTSLQPVTINIGGQSHQLNLTDRSGVSTLETVLRELAQGKSRS